MNGLRFFLPPAVIVNVKQLRILRMVRGPSFHAATFLVAFDRYQCLDWVAMEEGISSRWVPYSFVEGMVRDNPDSRPVNYLYRRDREVLFYSDASRLAVQSFHRLGGVAVPSEIRSLPPLRPQVMKKPQILVDLSASRAPLTGFSSSVEIVRVMASSNISLDRKLQVDYVLDVAVTLNRTSSTKVSFLEAIVTPCGGRTRKQL